MANVYRIGVSIAMSSNGAQVLSALSRNLLGVHAQANHLTGSFNRMKLAIGGALAVGAGVAVLGAVGMMVKATEDLTKEQANMRAAGLGAKDVAEATGRAWQMSGTIMGAKVNENLAAIAHLRAALGDLKEAERIAPNYQRNAVALGNLTGRDGEGEAYKLAQAIHLSGAANDPVTKKLRADLFEQQLKLYTAMIAAGGGKLQAGDLLQFQKQAGSYGGSLSNEGRIDFQGFIQAVGGQKAGTMLSTANRALKDGVLQKSSLAQLEKIGLIDPKMVAVAGGAHGHGNGASPGGGITFKPGALANETLWRQDAPKWVWDVLVPKLERAGVNGSDAQVNWIQHAKLTSNVTRMLSEMIRNRGVDQNEAGNARRALKVDQYSNVMATSLPANVKALHDSWHDFMAALGAPLIKPSIGALQALTGAIKGMTTWAALHPERVKLIGETLVAIGAGLIGLGVAAVAVAGFFALVAGGPIVVLVAAIGAIVGAVTALVVLNWAGISRTFNGVLGAINKFWDGVVAFARRVPGLGALIPKDGPPGSAPTATVPRGGARIGKVFLPGLHFPGDARKQGQAVGQGLAKGIGDSHSAAQAAASKVANGVTDATKAQLQIHSPSRVFIRIGRDIVSGLVLGLNGAAREAQGAASAILKAAKARMGGQVSVRAFTTGEVGPWGARSEHHRAPAVPPSRELPITVNTKVDLDGHKIATVVTHHQVKAAGQARSTGATFDPNRSLQPVALGYHP